ncbi:hypothetical protein F8M41_020116 [Gigaspora margarita]|uniref:Uncharacterized protein n=1 Tax=Gigaspora margarita TaxID=4874 RepID=A0A8H4EJZ6_GIGMA|nr:hypothetical protein F8M41_020116 [Gigaspora margarita]
MLMGDMPELMENILNNLKNEPNSLYSCALLLFESGAVLHKLVLSFSESFEFKPEIFYSIGRNEPLFSRLQHLSLEVIPEFNIENVTIFLKVLAKNIATISSLDLVICSDFEPRLFHSLFHAIIRIIKSQVQLKRFSLDGVDHPTEFYGIISALECQKNSLKEVIINKCGYNKEFKVLKYCETLETLRIRDCSSKLLNLLDCKISTLEVFDCPIDVQTIPLILENSGLLLQRLSFDPEDFGDDIHEVLFFLEALKSFCPNITYLKIKYIEFSIQLLELISNLQKLQFLSLYCYADDDIPKKELEIRVMQFAEILPLTLQYLDLGNSLQPCIDILLSHCKAPLKKLLIYRLYDEKHTRALIEFCIRNKALNYVGIYKYSDLDENFRKEVEAHTVNVALVPSASIVVNC